MPKSDITEIRFAVSAADVDRVAEIIGSFEVTGLVIDGAEVGAPGWVLAKTIGDAADSTLMRYVEDEDHVAIDLPWASVRGALVEAFPESEVVIGAELKFADKIVYESGIFALGGEHRAVLIGPRGDYMFRAIASGLERDLVAAPVGDHVLVGSRMPPTGAELKDDVSGGTLGASAGLEKSYGLVLWRRGGVSAFALMRKGNMYDEQVWEPAWRTIEPASHHRLGLDEWVGDITEDLRYGSSDGEGLIKAYKLSKDDAVRLRAVLRRAEPDFAELLEILGIPRVAFEVFDGQRELAQIPGATVYEATSLRTAVLAEMRGPQKLGDPDGKGGKKRRWRP